MHCQVLLFRAYKLGAMPGDVQGVPGIVQGLLVVVPGMIRGVMRGCAAAGDG